jgi:hypothetical protein
MNDANLKQITNRLRPTSLHRLKQKFVPKVKRARPITATDIVPKRRHRGLTLVQKEAIILARFGEFATNI